MNQRKLHFLDPERTNQRLLRGGGGGGGHTHLLHAVVEEGQPRVLVADEGALLDEADEDLRLGELGVELLVGSVSALQEPWRNSGREAPASTSPPPPHSP